MTSPHLEYIRESHSRLLNGRRVRATFAEPTADDPDDFAAVYREGDPTVRIGEGVAA